MGNLHQTCVTGYSEAYTIYIHLKRLRLIVDICMRFGLKESVCCALVEPASGKEKKVL
jgi:siroheme synthase